MNDSFVPLLSIQPHAANPSRPADLAAGALTHAAHPLETPRVTLKRDGDKVTHISVQCSCGQTIELACIY